MRVFADIDNDGDLDLYACAHAAPNRLYMNQGDGTFREAAGEYGLNFNGASVMMAFADYDLDGDLDGYLLTNHLNAPPGFKMGRAGVTAEGELIMPKHAVEYRKVIMDPSGRPSLVYAGQYDYLFRNDGGKFTDVTEEAGITGVDHGLSATWWDYDGDLDPDLYVANDFTDEDRLYRNNGDGTFTNVIAEALPHTPWFSMGSDAADINNDGRLDFIASDMSGSNHFRRKVGMGDMGRDLWFLERPVPRQYMRNAVYVNTGTERFLEAAYLTGLADTDWTWSTNFGDFDEDGRIDLFVTNGMTRDWQNADLKAHVNSIGGKKSAAGRRFWINQGPKKDANMAFRNLGDLQFESVGALWGLDHPGVSYGAGAGDLDRDGDLDLVAVHFGEQAGIYKNELAGSRRLLIRLHGKTSHRDGIGARISLRAGGTRQVREVALAHGFASSGESVVHFGLGSAETVEELTVHWPSGAVQQFEQLEADRFYEITEPVQAVSPKGRKVVEPMFALAPEFKPERHRESVFDDFARQPLLPNRLSRSGPGVAVGDVDGDGDADLFVGGASGQMGNFYLQTGSGRFTQVSRWTKDDDAGCEDVAAAFFDADNDGDEDLFVVSGSIECAPGDPVLKDRIYLNDGSGRFAKADLALPDLYQSGGCVAPGDFDRDGDIDVFVGVRSIPGRYPEPASSHLLINEGGKFEDAIPIVHGMVTGAAWFDGNGDGWMDLLVTEDWGAVRYWINRDGRLTEATSEAGLAGLTGWWTCVVPGDLDGDGDSDFVAGNTGLNTKYHATATEPIRLHYGDYDDSGKKRIIEAEFENGKCFPVRGKSCSTHAIPGLAKRFQSFADFARAELTEIYAPEKLEGALELEANTLESGVFLNDGNGKFRFRPFPRMAQVAPVRGIALTDLNADGFPDAVLAQNFFGPQRETGRMDGGVGIVLLGDGRGGFKPLLPEQSGIVVPGDAAALASGDFDSDGSIDFLFGLNDGYPVLYFRKDPRTSD